MKADGIILNINKPAGITSFQVVREVRRITGVKKVGHAGTLDPAANGVLIVLVGRGATKQFDAFAALTKTYLATFRLGIQSTTHDLDGEILRDEPVEVETDHLQSALSQYQGTIKQIPPMYSAKKQNGRRLYKLAQKGKTVKRKPAEVTIYDLQLLEHRDRDVRLRVTCSRGTYIRALARDVGADLDTHAVVAELTRTAVGDYQLQNAIPLDNLEQQWNFLAA